MSNLKNARLFWGATGDLPGITGFFFISGVDFRDNQHLDMVDQSGGVPVP
jgi:hypothetical protein